MRTYLLAGLLLALLATPIALALTRAATPEELAYHTVIALERHDAKALTDLASPAESKRAGITVPGITAHLNATIYREGDPGTLRLVKVNVIRPNCVQFLIETGRTSANGQPRRIVLTTQHDEGEPFRIALGELLWNLVVSSQSRVNPYTAQKEYLRLATQTGIHGYYTVIGGWTIFDPNQKPDATRQSTPAAPHSSVGRQPLTQPRTSKRKVKTLEAAPQ